MFFKRKNKPEVSSETLEGLDYTLIRTSRRSLAMQIKSDATLVVRAPYRMPVAEIERWILKKSRWIERHRRRFKTNKTEPLKFITGEPHLFLGQKYSLKIIPGPKAKVVLSNPHLIVSLRRPHTPERIAKALKAWYRAEGETIFRDRLDVLFPYFGGLGHRRPGLRLRWMKSRWGSLSAKREMTLNYKLVKAPMELIDYVIVHELCHLEHMNHGESFKALMTRLMPDWKGRKKALEGYLR